MKWKPKCFFLYAMFLCVFGAGSNEVITENPHKGPEEDDTSIQELHPPSAQTTAQTTRETNFLRDLDTKLEDSTTRPPQPTTVLHMTYKTGDPSTLPTPTKPSSKALDRFPEDVFSVEQRRKGWVLLHVLGLMFTLMSLVILSEEFFVPALRVIADVFALSGSVAGATVMAAACSTPRFFAFLVDVFRDGTKPGFDSIVGSAVFNILFVIGMCALFSREMLHLTWWPLFRDVSFYILDLVMLIVFFLDNVIVWWESLMLVGGYTLYVVFMKYNVQIERFVKTLLLKHRSTVTAVSEQRKENAADGSDEASRNRSHKVLRRSSSQQEAHSESQEEVLEENRPLSLQWPQTNCGRGLYLLRLPALLPLWLSLPDVRKQDSRKYVVLSLLGSLLWMSLFLFLFSWWTHEVAETLLVPDLLVDQLFSHLNLPVLLTALTVARSGHSDMSSSVALGSSVYEVTLGRPVSWLAFSAVHGWSVLEVSSSGLWCSVSLLSLVLLVLLLLLLVLASFSSCQLQIKRMMGFSLVLLYALSFFLSATLKTHEVFSVSCQSLSA